MRGWAKMFRQEAADACGATQYGVSTPGACVKLRHDLLLDWTLAPEKALVGVDLSNMHNSVKTARLESQVIHRVPRMAELMGWVRSARTHVYKGALHQVNPVDGLDQGCPASNALAPISIAEAHEDLQAFGSVYGLQDDTYILVDKPQVASLCDSLQQTFAPAGPGVNHSKCFVACHGLCNTGASGIVVTNDSPKVLKLPLPMPDLDGSLAFDTAAVLSMVAKRERTMEKLGNLRSNGLSSQVSYTLASSRPLGT